MTRSEPSPRAVDPTPRIAHELALAVPGVAAAIRLMAEGASVPFIARYRKEATGGLDEVQIRQIMERRDYLRALDERRGTVLASISGQGRLTAELEARIEACSSKAELEDLYLPYKPRRRTRAGIARERGLEPLAGLLLAQGTNGIPSRQAHGCISQEKGVPDIETAIQGARDIAAETMAENVHIRAWARRLLARTGRVMSTAIAGSGKDPEQKFRQYYSYSELAKHMPSHRYLAVCRGEQEGVLRVRIEIDAQAATALIVKMMRYNPASPWAPELCQAVEDGCRRLLFPSLEAELRAEMKARADETAVAVFASNLRNLLLASPLGERSVLGVDPGIRTGCKCAVADATGAILDFATIYPGQGEVKQSQARRDLVALVTRHNLEFVGVGNGTAGRETETFIKDTLASAGLQGIPVVMVNESGASVYSASDIAREEFPGVDVSLRGAASIARRLQDPLAELVKIDPKSIGVGQYQHDVHQPLLKSRLDAVVESCVNQVGVELNTASVPLLSYVAGIGPTLARRIVDHRAAHGPFKSRSELLEVHGLGPKTFEQAAGFLRVRQGRHPLDASAVHPERYGLVERMAADLGVNLEALVGDESSVSRIDVQRYVSAEAGEPTLLDILSELKRPGRDPRKVFEIAAFRDDVRTIEDLRPGMELEGVVTNVAAFGVFVDVGVHQDGLVHISRLADRFVQDPHEVVSAGDRITVRVLDVDLGRKRIALSARSPGATDSTPSRHE